jgi:signal transduction histidine kinase
VLRKRSKMLVLYFIIIFTLALMIETRVQAQEIGSSAIIVDRMDFPALYLTNPVLSGHAVWLLQARLKDLGYDIEPDGRYDRRTQQVVSIFQIAHGLKDTGVVSRPEWEVLMSIGQDEFCIAGDLCSIVGNLIDNALEAAVNDEQQPRVGIEIKKEDNNCLIYVYNNGTKISSHEIPKIFRPGYSRTSFSTRGFGLYLVKKLVEEYSGSINVITEPRTTFIVSLPLEENTQGGLYGRLVKKGG